MSPEDELVRRGAELLDRIGVPGWRDKIDPDRLDIDTGYDCVLGQLHGSYWVGLRALGIRNPRRFGLHCTMREDQSCNGEQLTAAWRRLLSGA